MIIVQTPLRISFLGGGTDFADFYDLEDGSVLSSAIDKYIFVIVKERFDDKIYINYSKKEIVDSVGEIQHELVREAMRMTGVHSGVEITTLADVPSQGIGLGSSSSVTVGLLHALYTYKGTIVSARELAEQACRIEIDILGKPIGKQDQYIAAFGNLCFINFKGSGEVEVEPLQLSSEARHRLQRHLMLFFTNMTRQSSEVLTEQKRNIPEKMECLRELRLLAVESREHLQKGDLDSLGDAMHRGWEIKKKLARCVSNKSIDGFYRLARKAGALGGKITGAGGGGFLLLYCPLKKQEAVRSALAHLRELPFGLEQDGTKVIFNIRR